MNPNEKTTEKLEEELKRLQIINGVLIGLLGILFIVCIYGLLKNDTNRFFSILIVVPITLSTSIPINYRNIKKIKVELASRK